jgi:hypothetical protein
MRLDPSLPHCQEQLKGPWSPQRTAGAYVDALQRLLAFQVDPLQAERPRVGALPFPGRAGQMGDWEGPLSSRPRQPGSPLCALLRWGRSDGLGTTDQDGSETT